MRPVNSPKSLKQVRSVVPAKRHTTEIDSSAVLYERCGFHEMEWASEPHVVARVFVDEFC